LPLGYRSRAEVFDLEFSRPPAVDLIERLNAVLADGLRVLAYRPILFKTPSLMSELGGASYRIGFPGSYLEEAGLGPAELLETLRARIPELLDREHVIVRRQSEDKARDSTHVPRWPPGLRLEARWSSTRTSVSPRAPRSVRRSWWPSWSRLATSATDVERTALWDGTKAAVSTARAPGSAAVRAIARRLQ
jgi:hypothetical protein